ncbi:amidohydrolase [Angustibacter aerolatus]|uniref:Amidohydrolase n=1 Tax=Angustibacter aerolatus TaxID=1162965 RepID=A0ABQ6JJS9_9ACTN|nr:amidohydrolase [Angustibacter aerolatus]
MHAHPEPAREEHRTTDLVAARLEKADVAVQRLPGTGLVAEVGRDAGDRESDVRTVGLRADMDALRMDDLTADPWRSTVDGLAHACGHDVHTVALLGAGLALREQHARSPLPGRVRLLFQPAEEVMPGGARDLLDAGVADGIESIYALHCDPSIDVGQVGLRKGPITSACDQVLVRLRGKGGHTSRPHLTQDLTFALAKVVTDVPAALSRRLDPRAGASLVWGYVRAGSAKNVVPSLGEAGGTLRILDVRAWELARGFVTDLVAAVVAPYGVQAEVEYVRGVPPVVNSAGPARSFARAATGVVGASGVVTTEQSLGGEDFAWYLERTPGAMARLGTRTPGGPTNDLHQGDLRVDDRAVPIGAEPAGPGRRRGAAGRRPAAHRRRLAPSARPASRITRLRAGAPRTLRHRRPSAVDRPVCCA